MTDQYRTITHQMGEGFYSEKRSKFLAFAHHVTTENEVKELLQAYKKKYYDARHCCYAYMLGADRSVFRANDDGEPSSTAGKPILGQINAHELTDILAVSTCKCTNDCKVKKYFHKSIQMDNENSIFLSDDDLFCL